ncbi:MAG: prolyl oligopeptidase family serine peptidase [Acidobacteriota bacterium]
MPDALRRKSQIPPGTLPPLGRRPLVAAFIAALLLPAGVLWGDAARSGAAKKALTFVDLMKFQTVSSPTLSDDGSTVVYQRSPDRGDGAVVAVRGDGSLEREIPLGTSPAVSADGRWVVAKVAPSLEAVETADGDKPEAGAAVLDMNSGDVRAYEHVKSIALSEFAPFVGVLHTDKEGQDPDGDEASEESSEEGQEGEEAEAAEEPQEGEATSEAGGTEETSETEGVEGAETSEDADGEEDDVEERLGTTLILVDLGTGSETRIEHVTSFAFSATSAHVAYAVAAPGGENGLFVHGLMDDAPPLAAASAARGHYSSLTWTRDPRVDAEAETLLAFVAAVDDEDGEPGDGEVWLWQASTGEGRPVATADTAPAGSMIPSVNQLHWSLDGQRLFYGTKPRPQPERERPESEEFDPYDLETLLDDTGVDVWHVNDPLIKTNERAQWNDQEKDRTFAAVYHRDTAKNVQLAGPVVRTAVPADNPRAVLGAADVPYLRERTWAGFYGDLYWISLDDGERQLVAERLPSNGFDPGSHLSPDGRYAVFFRDPDWYLFDVELGSSRNLTAGLGVSFADEDHDYPREASSHGLGGWLADSSAVLIHDRYDLWSFPTEKGEPVRVTDGAGREGALKLRLVDEGRDALDRMSVFGNADRVLLHGEREREKNHGFWRLDLGSGALEPLVESAHQYRFRGRALDADRVLFTRESYREFPDLRLGDPDFKKVRKLSDVNPQIQDFAWGHAERVVFSDADGRESDAVLIRPEGLEDGERCPVLVYYYRFFSHRLYSFNDPRVNHRPSFPVYASHGYCVFLPDVRFDVGRPGYSATKALVPAVQKIVEMGVADPDAIGLHGHSWSGYQTAHVITQTNIFAAAVAGAPVSNMTSAYGGIRYGTGLARQFQYEAGQSRLGRSLWEGRDLYIENSPLFFADRIETPLLIQFGDADEAVPWTQGVELYLAMRRLDKEAVFLQYRGEPHHLKQYPNKVDYSIKMKEFFDHYLKGVPAPVWLSEGVPYRGEDD